MTDRTNISDPSAHEAAKTPEERAEDIAYTVNHAISCGLTDVFVQPFASAGIVTLAEEKKLPKGLRWLEHIFEKHDHGHGHDDHHGHHHAKQSFGSKLWHNAKHWAFGEVVGDVGGIIPTVLIQRNFPGFMQGVRNVLEPVAGGVFHKGAHRDARKWARHHGYAADSPEARAKEVALYEHEMSHLPQAAVWNATSIPINYLAQAGLAASKGHSLPRIGEFAVGKVFGTVLSNSVLIGGRALSPESFNEWDRWDSKHVIRPVIRTVGGLFGVDEKTVDRMEAKEEKLQGDDWKSRVEKQAEQKEIAPDAPAK
jgi:hypothetical protein